MSGKAIVLDANILIRAVLGKRVRELIFDNAATVYKKIRLTSGITPTYRRAIGIERQYW
jgi:hypothetical protein